MKKRYGLMSYVKTGTLKPPTREEMEREFSRPWSMPKNIIMGSAEFINEFTAAIEEYHKNYGTGTTQNNNTPSKIS
jgi:hypothetical protein